MSTDMSHGICLRYNMMEHFFQYHLMINREYVSDWWNFLSDTTQTEDQQ